MVAPNLTQLTSEQQALAAANVALAYWVAKRYAKHFALDREECEAQALYGLCRAARGFRTGHGARFGTYATWCIRSTLARFRQMETRRPDRYARSLLGRRSEDDFWREDHNEPRQDDLPCPSQRREEVTESQRQARRALRLAGLGGRSVLEMRFFQGLTLQQIGDQLGITREAVRQRQIVAIQRVREDMVSEHEGPCGRVPGGMAGPATRQAGEVRETSHRTREEGAARCEREAS